MSTSTQPAAPATKSIKVMLDDKAVPLSLDCRRNQRNELKFYASISLDGQQAEIEVGDEAEVTIWDAARLWNLVKPEQPIDIPGLCHRPELGHQAVGVCRLCSVSVVENGRAGSPYAAACMRPCKDGMVVLAGDQAPDTDPKLAMARERLREARRTLVELLLAEHPIPCKQEQEQPGSCELEAYGRRYGLLKAEYAEARTAWQKPTVFKPRVPAFIPRADTSNFSIAIDHSACILCDRCVRACSHPDVDNRVIGRMGKGALSHIGFDNDLPMKESSCVNCGWCMVSCPTGAITYSGLPQSMDSPWPGAAPLEPEQIAGLELIKDGKISLQFLKRSVNGVVVKRFKKGEILCRQGEYGRTAFYINSGKINVYLNLPKKAAAAGKPGLLARLFGTAAQPAGTNPVREKAIPVSPGIELDPIRPVATLGEGTLFGEEACLNNQARSATIEVAEDDTEIVIMFRNFLDILTRDRGFRARLESRYRAWAIENHLRNSRYMAGLSDQFRARLCERASIVRFASGDTIFRETDPPDAFYMIRLGHVRVTRQARDGSDFTIRYMTAGEVFGEIGTLFGVSRTATCTALDTVQLVRIGREDFNELTATFPEIRGRLEERALSLLENEGSRIVRAPNGAVIRIVPPRTGPQPVPGRQTRSLKAYLDQELYQGQHMLVLDLEKCTRCDECVNACAQSHLGISRLIRDGLRYDKYLVTTSCRSCRDPKCLVGCPVDAIHRKGTLPIVIENHCVGCGKCAENCPFGNIALHPVEVHNGQTGETQMGLQAAVCNLDNCIEEKREPSCVYACPHDAAHRVNGVEFFGGDVLGSHENETAAQ